MNSKKWGISFIVLTLIAIIFLGGFTAVIDPYFHYHAPIAGLEYPIDNERYQNDGIVRNFKYDAIITGSSMTQNFKTTECNNIFNVNAIKVPFSGGSFKEVNDNLKRAFSANSDIKLVIRGLDGGMLKQDKDSMRYESYPTYLTDECFFNDVNYMLNKDVFLNDSLRVLKYTMDGNKTTTFDEYKNWTLKRTYGKEAVLSEYKRGNKKEDKKIFTEELRKQTIDNLAQNVTDLVSKNPDTEFYYFFPPYSIIYWDSLNQNQSLDMYIEIYTLATELMLEYENIHIFSFYSEYDMITNLDNYVDDGHYHGDVNSKILQWMGEGEHELTKENYKEYWNEIQEYYSTYDYESIFEN